jgi:pimeloyl-ACP methyl ester carboxylesterase
MLDLTLTVFFAVLLIKGSIVAGAYLWERFYTSPTGEDQKHYIRASDNWRLAVHRYEPKGRPVGLPVILCHGLGANRYVFDMPQGPSLARFLSDKGRDVWVPELRGSGMSDKPGLVWSDVPYTWHFEDFVEKDIPAVIAAVRDLTDSSRMHWVGHSMGGLAVVAYLASHDDPRIASVTAIGSPFDFSAVGRTLLRRAHRLKWILARHPFFPLMLVGKFMSPLAEHMPTNFNAIFYGPNTSGDVSRRIFAIASEAAPPCSLWRDHLRFVETGIFGPGDGSRYVDRLPDVPILSIGGSEDRLAPPGSVEGIPQSDSVERECLVLGKESGCEEDYGHTDLVVGLRAAAEVFPRIADWLERHDGDPGPLVEE